MKDTETIQTLKTLFCLINNSESLFIEISAETLESTIDLISRYNAKIERLKKYEDIRPTGCPNCHKGNFSNSKFCSHCGTQLQGQKIDAKSEAIREFEKELRIEINKAIESNREAKRERVDRLIAKGIVYNDEFCSYCDGKIHALIGIADFVENLVKEKMGGAE